jgi:predicted RNA-binding protein with TRAM domain
LQECYSASEKLIKTKAIEKKVGNGIDLFAMSHGDMKNGQPKWEIVSSVQIDTLTDQGPMGIQTAVLEGFNLIVPEATKDQLAIAPQEVTTLMKTDFNRYLALFWSSSPL